MISRIKEIATFYGLSSTAFADKVEIPRPVISHIFSERNRPSLEVVQKIGMAFPEVDLTWLLYGKGEMLKRIATLEVKSVVNSIQKENEVIRPSSEKAERITEPDPISNAATEAEHIKLNNKKRAVKIVFFFEDNTFEEFWA